MLSRFHRLLGRASTLLLMGGMACGESHGPPPSVRLALRGSVQSMEPSPIPIVGARVALKTFLGLTSNQVLATTRTDGLGNYELTYSFTSACAPEDDTWDWLEVSADGYETASTFAYVDVSGPVSDPLIRCTSTPQVIDLSLVPLGTLQIVLHTTGAVAPTVYYVVVITGLRPDPSRYGVEANGQTTLQVRPGPYPLELTEVKAGCTIAGENPRTVTVQARATASTTFEVTCPP